MGRNSLGEFHIDPTAGRYLALQGKPGSWAFPVPLDKELYHPKWFQFVEPWNSWRGHFIWSNSSLPGTRKEFTGDIRKCTPVQPLVYRDLSVKLGNCFWENYHTQVALQGVCQQGEVPATVSASPLAAALGNLNAALLLGRKTSVHPQCWK